MAHPVFDSHYLVQLFLPFLSMEEGALISATHSVFKYAVNEYNDVTLTVPEAGEETDKAAAIRYIKAAKGTYHRCKRFVLSGCASLNDTDLRDIELPMDMISLQLTGLNSMTCSYFLTNPSFNNLEVLSLNETDTPLQTAEEICKKTPQLTSLSLFRTPAMSELFNMVGLQSFMALSGPLSFVEAVQNGGVNEVEQLVRDAERAFLDHPLDHG
jgi:hypothetical protein